MYAAIIGTIITCAILIFNFVMPLAYRIDWKLIMLPLVLGYCIALGQVIHASCTRR